MANVFCSNTLTSLIGKSHLEKSVNINSNHPLDLWNANVFYVNRKKCILFTNKLTLLCVVRLNIVKKDLNDLQSFFKQSLERQLEIEEALMNPEILEWFNNIKAVFFHSTDNDKKVIGSMNDFIFQITTYVSYSGRELENIQDTEMAKNINEVPMGMLKNKTPHFCMINFKSNV